ncbi:hypothetical protein AKJ16_DCAP23485, partial [Drosera capensis]
VSDEDEDLGCALESGDGGEGEADEDVAGFEGDEGTFTEGDFYNAAKKAAMEFLKQVETRLDDIYAGNGGPVVGTQGVNGNGSNGGIDGSDGVRGGVVRGGGGGRGATAYYSRKTKSADPSLHHYGELVGVTMILKDIGFDLEKVLVNVGESTSDDQENRVTSSAAEVLVD